MSLCLVDFSIVTVMLLLVANCSTHTTSVCPSNLYFNPELKRCVACPEFTMYNDSLSRCVSRPGVVTRCNEGYQYDSVRQKCLDVDECKLKAYPCDMYDTCINTEGSYQCKKIKYCGPGFRYDLDSQTCKDIDECVENIHRCGQYICFNIRGSFQCRKPCTSDKKYYYNNECHQCEEGFAVNRTTGQCYDVDECLEGLNMLLCIPYKERCVTKPIRSICEKHCSGGTEEFNGGCYDINECMTNSHNCTKTQRCLNEFGTFSCMEIVCNKNEKLDTENRICVCKPGFTLSMFGEWCGDIDECKEIRNPCGLHGKCKNKIGGYECLCDDGYRDVNGTCQDIDECQTMAGVCGHLECENTMGKFNCVCPPGYRKNPENVCEDINECKENSTICHTRMFVDQHECFNLIGTFKCISAACPWGYSQVMATDSIRKCELNDHQCSYKNQEGCYEQLGAQLIFEVVQIKANEVSPYKIGFVDVEDLRIENYAMKILVKKSVDLTTKKEVDINKAIRVRSSDDESKVAFQITKSLPDNTEVILDVFVMSGSGSSERLYAKHRFYVFVNVAPMHSYM